MFMVYESNFVGLGAGCTRLVFVLQLRSSSISRTLWVLIPVPLCSTNAAMGVLLGIFNGTTF